MLFDCLSGSKPSKHTKEEVIYVSKLKAENVRLMDQNTRLLTVNQELREQVKRLQEDLANGHTQVVDRLKSMQQQADRQLAESARIARDAEQAREEADAKDAQCQELRAALEKARAQLGDSMAEVDSAAAKLGAAEQRAVRHAREKAKLMDQIQRRDHALLLARQVIDMVDRTGVLVAPDGSDGSCRDGAPPLGLPPLSPSAALGRSRSGAAPGGLAAHQESSALPLPPIHPQPNSPAVLGTRKSSAKVGSAGGTVAPALSELHGLGSAEFGAPGGGGGGAGITSAVATPRKVVLGGDAVAALDELRRSLPQVRAVLDASTPRHASGNGAACRTPTSPLTPSSALLPDTTDVTAGSVVPERSTSVRAAQQHGNAGALGTARGRAGAGLHRAGSMGASSMGGGSGFVTSDSGSGGATSGEDLLNPLWQAVSEPDDEGAGSPGANPAYGRGGAAVAAPARIASTATSYRHTAATANRATTPGGSASVTSPAHSGDPRRLSLSKSRSTAASPRAGAVTSPSVARLTSRSSGSFTRSVSRGRDDTRSTADQPSVSLFHSGSNTLPPNAALGRSGSLIKARTGNGGNPTARSPMAAGAAAAAVNGKGAARYARSTSGSGWQF